MNVLSARPVGANGDLEDRGVISEEPEARSFSARNAHLAACELGHPPLRRI
jgi:hypothetical protein